MKAILNISPASFRTKSCRSHVTRAHLSWGTTQFSGRFIQFQCICKWFYRNIQITYLRMSVGVPTNDRWCSLLSARRERRIHRYTHTWHWGYHETSGMTRGIWTAASNRAALEIQKTKTNGELNGEFIHWKPRVIVMPTLSSLEAPVVVVITTTTGASIGENLASYAIHVWHC